MTVQYFIAHAKWIPERGPTYARLREQLGNVPTFTHFSEKPEHASKWAKTLWEQAAASSPNDHYVFLNDDVILTEGWAENCDRIAALLPNDIVSLHTVGTPPTPTWGRFFRSYWLTGPAYMFPGHRVRDLLAWEATQDVRFFETVNEDNLVMNWCFEIQRPIYHAFPAIVRHDTTVKSTLGYDHHPLRTPESFATKALDWNADNAPHVPCPWMSLHALDVGMRARRDGGPCTFCWQFERFLGGGRTGCCRDCMRAMFDAVITRP